MRTLRMPRIDRNLARVLIVCICFVGAPAPAAWAEMIATDRVEAQGQAQISARQRVNSLLDRTDVRAALESRGVSADQAKARVAALSDSEVEGLSRKIDSLPAGAGGFETVLSTRSGLPTVTMAPGVAMQLFASLVSTAVLPLSAHARRKYVLRAADAGMVTVMVPELLAPASSAGTPRLPVSRMSPASFTASRER